MKNKSLSLGILALSLVHVGLTANEVTRQATEENNGIGLNIAADALYLKGSTSAGTVAYEVAGNGQTTAYGSALNLKSNMSWGSNVGAGYKFGCDKKSEVFADWTHINSNWEQGPTTAPFIRPVFIDLDLFDTVGYIKSASHVLVNYYDLAIGHSFSLTRNVYLKPFVGISGATIKQHFSEEFNGVDLSQLINSSYSSSRKGIGILIGASFNWDFGWGVSLAANAKYAYLFNRAKITSQFHNANNTPIDNPYTYSHQEQSYYVDLKLGLNWMKEFYRGALKTGLGAGWKMSAFQNGWIIGNSSGSNNGSLNFQGLYLNSYIGF